MAQVRAKTALLKLPARRRTRAAAGKNGSLRMQRRRLIQAIALAPAASLGVAPYARGQAVEKPKLTIAVGGKNLLYYLPLTIAEGAGATSRPKGSTSRSPISPAARGRCRPWSAAAPAFAVCAAVTRRTMPA